MSSFYPYGGPAIYSYTEEFKQEHSTTGKKAYRNTSYSGLHEKKDVPDQALIELEALIQGARAAEVAFLAATGVDLSQGANAKTIFESINEILNSQKTFERAVNYMKKIHNAKKDNQKVDPYREVTKLLDTYVDNAIKIELKNAKKELVGSMPIKEVVKQTVDNIMTTALENMYKQVKDFEDLENNTRRLKQGSENAQDNEREIVAVQDMIKVVQSLRGKGIFGKFSDLLNIDTDAIEKELKHPNQNIPDIVFKKHNNFKIQTKDTTGGGNALELITSAITPELAKMNIHTGGAELGLNVKGLSTGALNYMKADSFLIFGIGTLDPKQLMDFKFDLTDSESTRIQNQAALQDYLQRLGENVKHIVAISDKNYSIGTDFRGFHAQSKMRLDYAKEMLGNFGVGDVTKLVDYLANSGASMIQGGNGGDVRTALASYIGYFLFDHLEVEGQSTGVNVVNLINLSGMYIPLSVYLEGLYKSLQNALHNYTSYVKVRISLEGPTAMDGSWSAATWESFRQQHESESFIEYHVLRGVADFVTGLMN